MGTDPADRASAVLEIDVAGIVANWRFLAQRVAPAECAAVVKANGYGLGAAVVAAALAAAGCRHFFVATLDEALGLRETLSEPCEIAVFNGPVPGSAEEFAAARLVPVLNDPGQIAEWQQLAAARRPLPAMLHLDTGMARLGLTRARVRLPRRPPRAVGDALLAGIAEPPRLRRRADAPLNQEQRTRFLAARCRLGGVPASLAASSGIFLGPDYHFDFVRPGAALYGVNPQPGRPNPMRQVVRLKARILQVRDIDSR